METSGAAENTAAKQRGRPFEPGRSGNPNGRPKGARNQATILAEALIDGEAETITRKLIDKALEGDPTALRLCLDRLLPPRRVRSVALELPDKIETSADALRASGAVLKACAAGELSASEAAEFINLISSHVRIIDSAELEARVASLEKELQT